MDMELLTQEKKNKILLLVTELLQNDLHGIILFAQAYKEIENDKYKVCSQTVCEGMLSKKHGIDFIVDAVQSVKECFSDETDNGQNADNA
jgi:hypothetical protein